MKNTYLAKKIEGYFVLNKIDAIFGTDLMTGTPEGQEDQILKWDIDKLGPKPTQKQLDDAWKIYSDMLDWDEIRIKRNSMLSSCDWTQTTDYNKSNKSEWATYRQALRDITTQSDPDNIVWPTPPN